MCFIRKDFLPPPNKTKQRILGLPLGLLLVCCAHNISPRAHQLAPLNVDEQRLSAEPVPEHWASNGPFPLGLSQSRPERSDCVSISISGAWQWTRTWAGSALQIFQYGNQNIFKKSIINFSFPTFRMHMLELISSPLYLSSCSLGFHHKCFQCCRSVRLGCGPSRPDNHILKRNSYYFQPGPYF